MAFPCKCFKGEKYSINSTANGIIVVRKHELLSKPQEAEQEIEVHLFQFVVDYTIRYFVQIFSFLQVIEKAQYSGTSI